MTSKSYQVSGHTFIQFRLSKIKRGAFDQMHEYVISVVANTDKTLNDMGIPFNGQFKSFPACQLCLCFPVEFPADFFRNAFEICTCDRKHFCWKSVAGDGIYDAVCKPVYFNSNMIYRLFHPYEFTKIY